MRAKYTDIEQHISSFVSVSNIKQGSHNSPKYVVESADGEHYFLKTYTNESLSRMFEIYKTMQTVFAADIPTAEPIDVGVYSAGGGYILSECLEAAMNQEAYIYTNAIFLYMAGRESARFIHKLHNLPIPKTVSYGSCLHIYEKRLILMNENKGLVEGLAPLVDDATIYFNKCRSILSNRPISLLHGDFNGLYKNVVLCKNGSQKWVDYDEFCYGDPWEEFRWLLDPHIVAKEFENGMLHSYFRGDPPDDFWVLLPLYLVFQYISQVLRFLSYDENHPHRKRVPYHLKVIKNACLLLRTVSSHPQWYQAENNYFQTLAQEKSKQEFVILGLQRTKLMKPIAIVMRALNKIRHTLKGKRRLAPPPP